MRALACLMLLGCASTPIAPTAGETGGATSAEVLAILPLPAASAATEPAPPPWKVGAVLKHLPPHCEYGRGYANLDELFGGGGTADLARLAQKQMPLDRDGEGLRAIMDAFGEAGKNPYAALKEIGFCFDSADGRSVTALVVDLSGIDAPAALLAKAIERKEGHAPNVSTANGFVWIEHDKGRVAAVGDNVIVVGYTRDAVEAGIGGSLTPPDFADADRHVLWARIRDKDTSLAIRQIGDDLDVRIETDVGAGAASMVSSFQSMMPALETMVNEPKLAPLKPLLPALRRASFQASGERMTMSTRMPKTVVREVLQSLVDGPGLQLEHQGF